tara:strand:+ start:60 stop:704 length:645 start_codon:yes stop_codon:yes gene_type:complete
MNKEEILALVQKAMAENNTSNTEQKNTDDKDLKIIQLQNQVDNLNKLNSESSQSNDNKSDIDSEIQRKRDARNEELAFENKITGQLELKREVTDFFENIASKKENYKDIIDTIQTMSFEKDHDKTLNLLHRLNTEFFNDVDYSQFIIDSFKPKIEKWKVMSIDSQKANASEYFQMTKSIKELHDKEEDRLNSVEAITSGENDPIAVKMGLNNNN